MKRNVTRIYRVIVGMGLLMLSLSTLPAPAAGAATAQDFGSGLAICTPPVQPVTLVNPVVVTDCTQAGLQAALNDGGHIAFDCGPDPVTIPLTAQLELTTTADTMLDGGGLVTLDGQGQTRILHKGWHDPALGDVTINLQNLRLINGKAPAGGGTGDHSGGAINVGHPGTRLHVINTTFQNNTTTSTTVADNQGGAIFVHNSYETVIAGSVFEANSAGNGGAFGGIATGLFVYNTTFRDNTAVDTTSGGVVRGYGGAIHLDGVTNSYNPDSNKRVHVCGSTFEANSAVRGGGATVVTISDNKGTRVTYERSTFEANGVSGLGDSYGQGGAIYHIEDDHAGGVDELNLEILDSTFHANEARRQGGGVWLYILGRGEVANCTFDANTTTAPFNAVGQGGAMVVTLGQIDVLNTTFAHNHAAYQAGALHGGGSGDPNRVITLTNTIFYSNTLNIGQTKPSETQWQGFHTNRPLTDGGQNIQYPRFKPVYDNEVNNPITGNPIYADPLLEALADNGGPTLTMALQAGSPAIDAGGSECPTTDQRGVLRQGPCDIGAYEYVNHLVASPTIQTLAPGASTIYRLTVVTGDGSGGSFTLAAANPDAAHLTLALHPTTINPGETATLTVTDHHAPGALTQAIQYTIPLSATAPLRSADILSAWTAPETQALTTHVQLIVGGASIYLPLITRRLP